MKRIFAYIDGFNLYYGLKESGWKKYYWLDLVALIKQFLPKDQILLKAKYFTANISGDKDKMLRQKTFLNAQQSQNGDGLEIIKGNFLKKRVHCSTHQLLSSKANFSPCLKYNGQRCDGNFEIPEEKKTDVNIATAMLVDTFTNKFDIAYLVSGDTDLIPPIQAIYDLEPEKKIVVLFPPQRNSDEMKKLEAVSRCSSIKEDHLKNSQLPPQIKLSSGAVLTKPSRWC